MSIESEALRSNAGDRPLRVLQFVCPSGFYGAERWILALANGLDPERSVCHLAVTDESPDQDLEILKHYPTSAGTCFRLAMRGAFDPRVITDLARLLKKERIDVIHTHGYKSDLIGLLAARLGGAKIVSTPHGFGVAERWKQKLYRHLGCIALRRCDAVAPLSVELREELERYRIPKRKVRLIVNGVDLAEVYAVRDEMTGSVAGVPEGTKVGFIGQIIPRKRLDLALAAFDRAWRERPELHLLLVGDGSSRSDLESLARTLPSSSHIHWLGFRQDRLDVLKALDLFVMTSESEGIPRCMMESMAMGVPIAAFDTPGVDLLVENGKDRPSRSTWERRSAGLGDALGTR